MQYTRIHNVKVPDLKKLRSRTEPCNCHGADLPYIVPAIWRASDCGSSPARYRGAKLPRCQGMNAATAASVQEATSFELRTRKHVPKRLLTSPNTFVINSVYEVRPIGPKGESLPFLNIGQGIAPISHW
jgi:hypothetical protein